MVLLIVQTESDTRAKVINIYPDASKLSAEIKALGILVDSVLKPTIQVGQDAVLYINPLTLEQWYEYEDRPATFDELLIDVKSQLALIKVLVLFVIPKWSSKNVAYEKKDIVRLPSGDIYQCLINHNSTDALKPTVAPAYWTLIASA